MSELPAILLAFAGGLAGGLVGVGGGVLFVPALTIFLGLTQVEAESTSLLMIVLVAFVGARRQIGYGNVRLREAVIIGALSPLGVLIGVRSPTTSPNAPCSSPSPPWRCFSPPSWSAAPALSEPDRAGAMSRSKGGFPYLGKRPARSCARR